MMIATVKMPSKSTSTDQPAKKSKSCDQSMGKEE